MTILLFFSRFSFHRNLITLNFLPRQTVNVMACFDSSLRLRCRVMNRNYQVHFENGFVVIYFLLYMCTLFCKQLRENECIKTNNLTNLSWRQPNVYRLMPDLTSLTNLLQILESTGVLCVDLNNIMTHCFLFPSIHDHE